MKTTPKLVITAIGLILFFLLTSSFNKQQTGGNKYLMLKTMEFGTGNSSKIMIVYEDGKTEEIPLDRSLFENQLPNSIKVTQAINNIANKGYELVSSTGDERTSIYIFLKK